MRGRSCSSTFEVLFVFLLYNRSQLTRRRSKAFRCSKQQMYKKINDTAKISLPLGQIIHQRAWLLLSILFDIAAWTFNTGKGFRKLKRQKLQIFSSIFFYLFVLFVHLSYIFILYVYLFIYYFPPSASAVSFLILQTPWWGRRSQPLWRWLIWKLWFLIKSATPN